MQITYEDLTRSSVHKVREIARNIGVKSPTLLTKQKLIEQILKIHNHEIEPSFNKRRVGRPPKSLSFNPMPNSYATYELNNKKDGVFTLNYPSSYFISSVENEQTKEFKGCLYIDENYGVFLTSNKLRVIVNLALIKHNKLRTGDKITVKANPDPSHEKVYIAISIIEGEGFKLGEDRPFFDNLKIVKESRKLENNCSLLEEINLHLGDKYFIETTNPSKMHYIAGEIIKNFKNTDCKTLYLNFDGNRNKNIFEGETKILFNQKEREKILIVDTFIEYVKRKVEQGKNCVVIFSSLWKYMRDLNLYYNKHTSVKVLLQTISKVRDIIALARNTENNASITMFIIDNLDMPEMYEEVMKYDVLANIDNKVKVDI